ncbi:hypothetical protein ACJJID_16640 [Microbulbifer sp. CnH-101-G]|uniref:hypothetical protein n=1 Tax=Microbulbifer sp. CnH-101-G TaxID=3243393 RepID=UPI0040394054
MHLLKADITPVLILAGIIWACWHFDIRGPWKDEITVQFEQKKCDDREECKWAHIPRRTFKVNESAGTVLSWETSEGWPIDEHKDCKIISRKHWQCGKENNFGLNEGVWVSSNSEFYRSIPKTQWWILHFAESEVHQQ